MGQKPEITEEVLVEYIARALYRQLDTEGRPRNTVKWKDTFPMYQENFRNNARVMLAAYRRVKND